MTNPHALTPELVFAQSCSVLTASLSEVETLSSGPLQSSAMTTSSLRSQQSKAVRKLLAWAVRDRKGYENAVLSDPKSGPLSYGSVIARVWVSLSHSSDRVGVAISDIGPVGFDLEVIRDRPNWPELAQVAWPNGPQPSDQTGFYVYWTLWEACVKCDAQDMFAEIADRCTRSQPAGWAKGNTAGFNYAFRIDGQSALAVVQRPI